MRASDSASSSAPDSRCSYVRVIARDIHRVVVDPEEHYDQRPGAAGVEECSGYGAYVQRPFAVMGRRRLRL